MDILLTGSVAYDYLMTFPGLFREQILPERLGSISLSFLVDSMSKQRGGIAPNIAYTMALLGEKPRVMATVGKDFGDYRAWLESKGVDTSLMKVIPGMFTASFSATTDQASAQFASFYPGAMGYSATHSLKDLDKKPDLVIVSPSALFTDGISEAMNEHADCFGEGQLAEQVEEHGHLPFGELRERILREITAFVGVAPQHDDMTMILMKVDEPAGAEAVP